MVPGTLEYEIYREECYRLNVSEAQIAQGDLEDWIAESPVQLCPRCNAPFKSLGEAYCEECQKASQEEWHSETPYQPEYCPF
jgi:tRNA(Ile2) C34 agmatinyltransferase TiaS